SGDRPLLSHFLCPDREDAPQAREVLAPILPFQEGAAAVGNVAEQADPDGVFRRISRYVHLPEGALPSLFQATLNVLTHTPCGGSTHPLTLPPLGNPARRYLHLSVARVLAWASVYLQTGRLPDSAQILLRNRIVFLGSSAPGLHDLRPSPYSPTTLGVDFHAMAVDAGLQHRSLRGLGKGVQIPLGLLWVLLLLVLRTRHWHNRTRWVGGELGLSLLLMSLQTAALRHDVALPLLYLLGLQWLTLITHLAWRYEEEWRKRRWIRRVLGLYLSPDVLDTVLAQPNRLRLGGERREITVYFSDIRGFTTLAETLDPERLAELLNAYLSRVTAVLFAHGATLDKYLGDGVMAFWNAPLDQPDHVDRACAAAMDVQRVLEAWNRQRTARGDPPLWTGIGIHTGTAVVGNLGSPEHFDYTAVGDTVNTASRLEGLTRHFGVPVVVSEDVVQRCSRPFTFRPLGWVQVKGRQTPLAVFALRAEPYPHPESWQRFLLCLKEGRQDEALRLLHSLPEDPVVEAYRRWIREGRLRDDGTVTLTQK
ncbi:MAG: adenylate/guanylate cyclase domain-containing protein, partial [Candidatus Hydrothermae bacterium]|nr:adenylate/guanylate cyclase domain-containing protein [Candidatus Hydrothermae bacterium]